MESPAIGSPSGSPNGSTICDGKGEETWSPRFTFHSFQYVEITGLKSPPTDGTVTGVALSSDTPVVGRFECSDPMLNKLHGNGYWTQRANFIDIPTDCPQRDERLGWTGDAQVYIRTATLNCDVQAFFTITPAAKKVIYQPEARARDPVRFPRWRVGLICSSMRNFLAGVISGWSTWSTASGPTASFPWSLP